MSGSVKSMQKQKGKTSLWLPVRCRHTERPLLFSVGLLDLAIKNKFSRKKRKTVVQC